MRSIGIDIGRYSIKICIVRSSSGGYVVEDYFESPFSSDITHDPYIHTLEVLRRLANNYDPATTKFCLALPQASICSRFKVFPFKERFKVIKSIAFELEDDIPYDQDEAVFDAKILRVKNNTSEVLAVASPHEHIRQLLHICEEAGIDPDIISMEASAIANLVEDWWTPPQEKNAHPESEKLETDEAQTATNDDDDDDMDNSFDRQNIGALKLLVHIGHTKTIITAYADSRLISAHSISYGGREIIRNLSEKYSLSYPEALKTFQEKGFILTSKKAASKDQVYFSDCISGSMQNIVNETKRFLLSLHADFQFELDSLFLSGGVSQLINVGAYFTQAFEVAVNPYDHRLRHKFIECETDESFRFRGGLAAGLAIEGIKLARNPAINFRQGELAKQNKTWNYIYERWGKSIQIGAVFMLSLFLYAPLKSYFAGEMLSAANADLKKETKNQGLRGREARGSGLKRYIRRVQAGVKSQKKLKELENMNSALDVVDMLTKSLPPKDRVKLDIKKLELNYSDLKIEGYVKDQAQLQTIDASIRNLSVGGFQKTRPTLKKEKGKLAFGYTLKVKRMEKL